MPDSTLESSPNQLVDDPLVAYALKLGGVVSRVTDLDTGEIREFARVAPGREEDEHARGTRGLSYIHISPGGATLTIAKGGGLIKATRPYRDIERHPGKRGEVTPFNRAMKRRMLYKLASIKRETKPDFVTLTYPGRYEGDVKTIKRDIDVFAKRLRRIGGGAIWRLEFKERLTGESQGQIVPHYHLFMWWPSGMSFEDRRHWLSDNWYEVVDSGQEDHHKAGTKCERMRSWRGVMRYASKYITKDVEVEIPEHCGRQWGWINRDAVPWAELQTEAITNAQCRQAFKLFENMAGSIWRDECPSRTLLVDDPEMWRSVVLNL